MRSTIFTLLLLVACGCDHYYEVRFDIRDSSGLPLSDVEVFGEEYREKELANTLHLGKSDKQGKLKYGSVGRPELTFEFRKAGYETQRQEYQLSERTKRRDEGVVSYTILLEDDVNSRSSLTP